MPNIILKPIRDIPTSLLIQQMNDPRVTAHLPLKMGTWDQNTAEDFLTAKEKCWQQDGLGHQAIFVDGRYAGWGGFQKEGEEWDFGLVLTAEAFGLGLPLTRHFLKLAREDDRIPHITFLLPPSRRHTSALKRMGAEDIGAVTYDGQEFRKFQMETK